MGIFPYVLKLLQSSARELRPLLVLIWAKIMVVDNVSWLLTCFIIALYRVLLFVYFVCVITWFYYELFHFQSCQMDLIKDGSHKYFLLVLTDSYLPVSCRSLLLLEIMRGQLLQWLIS